MKVFNASDMQIDRGENMWVGVEIHKKIKSIKLKPHERKKSKMLMESI